MSVEYKRKYFQCNVSNGTPDITQFGLNFNYRLNQAETSAIVLVTCTDQEFTTAEENAGIEEKTFIELTKEEAKTLSKSWD